MSERGKSHCIDFCNLTVLYLSHRITRAFMIEELNSIKQKAAQAEGGKKKGKKGRKTKK